MSVAPIPHSVPRAVQPRLLTEPAPIKATANFDPMRKFIVGLQDHALDGVGAHSSAVIPFRDSRHADRKHDEALAKARVCLKRAEYAMADYWIEQAQHFDAHEDALIERMWSLFSQAADACRAIVRGIERLLRPGGSK